MAWTIGEAQLITWTTDDFYYADENDLIQPDSVKLEVSHNGGSSWAVIVADTPNTGSYSWVVTGPATATAIIRYSGVHNTEITAETVAFEIIAVVPPAWPPTRETVRKVATADGGPGARTASYDPVPAKRVMADYHSPWWFR